MPRPSKPDEIKVINMTTNQVYDLEPPFEDSNTWYKTNKAVLINALRELGNPKVVVFAELLRMMSYSNQVHNTIPGIAREAGVSQPTVDRALKDLIAAGVVKRVRNAHFMINPRIMRNGKRSLSGMAKAEWEKLR